MSTEEVLLIGEPTSAAFRNVNTIQRTLHLETNGSGYNNNNNNIIIIIFIIIILQQTNDLRKTLLPKHQIKRL